MAKETFATTPIAFVSYKLKTVIMRGGTRSIHDTDDVQENTCSAVSIALEKDGKASCVKCDDESCIANFQKVI